MPIEGQGSSPFDDRGFTMVVLLVVIAVMGIGMSAMWPTWRQQSIREKEEELIFRGNQYARAIALYARKNNNVLPANVDVLADGKYLRKKWKDPITGTDFGLLPAGQPANAGRGVPLGPGAPGGAGGGGTPTTMGGQAPGAAGARGVGPGSQVGTQIVGSFQGVYSTSPDTSIRVYQNQQRYMDWQFTVQTANVLMGQGARGGGQPPGRAGAPVDGRGGTGGARGGTPGGVPGRGAAPGQGVQPGIGQPQAPGRGGAVPPGGPGGRGRGNF